MYKKILIPIENGPSDKVILDHILPIATLMNSELFLVHVADGWAARNFYRLNLAESEEMKADRAYLNSLAVDLKSKGFIVDFALALGEPSVEIAILAKQMNVDLIAMATHGHRFFADLIYGSTADKLRHSVSIPVLMVRDTSAS